jgi:DHA2 family multidrug resistance protein
MLDANSPTYRWMVLVNVMIGTFMAVMDGTIVNVALPKLMATFGVSSDKISWVVTAYMIVSSIMLPSSGWLADTFGTKRLYFLSLLLFTTGSFLCGLAWSENMLILFRILQGLGAGCMMPIGMAIVMREFPSEQRGKVLGFWGISGAASVSFGPMLGGYLIDTLSWQSIFFVNVPTGIACMIFTMVVQREYRLEKASSFDAVGFISMAVFLGVLLLALTNANAAWNIGGWSSPYILGCLALSGVSFVIFLITELTIEHPLIELRLFKHFNFGVTNVILFTFGLGMFGSTFLMPLYLQNVLNYTALQTGALFLPVGLLQGLFSPIAGTLSDRLNPKLPAVTGIALLALSFFLNTQLSVFSENQQISVVFYLRGLGFGLAFSPLNTLALSGLQRDKMAQASGLFNVIRQVGGSFGIAILQSILSQRVNFHSAMLGQALDRNSPVFDSVLRGLQTRAVQSAGSSPARAAQQAQSLLFSHLNMQAFVYGITDCFLFAGAVTAAAILPVILLRFRRETRLPKPAKS